MVDSAVITGSACGTDQDTISTALISLSGVKPNCVFQSESRISISTNNSDSPKTILVKPRRKQRPSLLSNAAMKHWQPMDPAQALAISQVMDRLNDVCERLEEEIEPFSIRECKPATRACQLAARPAASSLMKRRGVVMTLNI